MNLTKLLFNEDFRKEVLHDNAATVANKYGQPLGLILKLQTEAVKIQLAVEMNATETLKRWKASAL